LLSKKEQDKAGKVLEERDKTEKGRRRKRTLLLVSKKEQDTAGKV
jgi:hypothetical protein